MGVSTDDRCAPDSNSGGEECPCRRTPAGSRPCGRRGQQAGIPCLGGPRNSPPDRLLVNHREVRQMTVPQPEPGRQRDGLSYVNRLQSVRFSREQFIGGGRRRLNQRDFPQRGAAGGEALIGRRGSWRVSGRLLSEPVATEKRCPMRASPPAAAALRKVTLVQPSAPAADNCSPAKTNALESVDIREPISLPDRFGLRDGHLVGPLGD